MPDPVGVLGVKLVVLRHATRVGLDLGHTDAAGQVIDANADGVPDKPVASLLRRSQVALYDAQDRSIARWTVGLLMDLEALPQGYSVVPVWKYLNTVDDGVRTRTSLPPQRRRP